MANENKKINELVSESGEDTSELEILSDTVVATPEGGYEMSGPQREVDAATHAFEPPDGSARRTAGPTSALLAELRQRDQQIGDLRFDIEQLRVRHAGLEKELEAREEITRNINDELRQSAARLADVRKELAQRQASIDRLEEALREQSGRLAETEAALERARQDNEARVATIEGLRSQQADASRRIDALNAALDDEVARRKSAEDAERLLGRRGTELEEQLDEARAARAALEQYVEGRRLDWEDAQRRLSSQERSLADQARTIARMTREATEAADLLREEHTARQHFEGEERTLREALARVRAEAAQLGAIVAESEAMLREREAEIAELGSALNERLQQLEDITAEEKRLAAALATESGARASLQAEHDTLLAEHRSVVRERDSLDEDTRRLRDEVRTLGESLARAEELEEAHARLSGMHASSSEEARRLAAQLAQVERYADGLRDKLGKRIAETQTLGQSLDSAEAARREADGRIEVLAADLEDARRQKTELERRLEETGERARRDAAAARAELEAARNTIANQEAAAVQLSSQLAAGQAQARELETRLAENDEARTREKAELERQVAELTHKVEEYEHKLANKEAAIHALLKELAGKAEGSETRTAGEVVHRLPERRAAAVEERGSNERVTRLLIGNVDGQTLRYPLFKDKVTIGRTAHNDIQLKAQYVSRRHAVVIAEDDCTRIVDWGSKNGLFVNGARVGEQVLKNGDRLTIGTAQFLFEERSKR